MATDIISEAPVKASAATTVEALQKQIADLTQQVEAFNLMALAAQNSDNAVIVTDRGARVEWVNDAFTRLTGYALRELKGRSPGSFLQSDETNPATIAYMRERIASGQPFEADIVNRRKDGAHYWARIEAKPILDAQGNVSHYMGIQRDITVKRRMEKSLELHHEVLQQISDACDIGSLLPSVLKLIAGFIGWPIGIAWEVKGKRWVGDVNVRCSSVWASNPLRYAGYLGASQKLVWQKGEHSIGQVWERRKTTFIHDLNASHDPWRSHVAAKESLQSSLIVPILSGDRVTYLLEFTGPRIDPPDHDLIQLLEVVCIQLSHFIDRKRDELRVRQFMTEFDCLFKLSPDGFVVFNTEGIRSYGNPAFYTMTGLTRERLDGVTETEFDGILASLCAPEFRPRTILDIATSGDNDRLQLVCPKPAVLERSVRDMFDSMGRYIGRAVYLRDITKEMEVDRMKSEFLSTAAHELRTPMVSVHGFTELLLKRNFSDERKRDIYETIHRQSTLLVNMVTELLDLARIEARAGKEIHIRPLEVMPVVSRAIDSFLFPGDTRTVTINVPEGLPHVFADEEHLVRALTNIISNAYKYSPHGGDIALDVVERGLDMGPQVGIRVTDHGIGMTPEQLNRVCERFYRADPSGNIPGTGLGMSLVKEIMSLLGGEVEIRSEFGQGTEVTLWLRVVTDAYRD
ncbi:MAG: ATP-binding protein [Aquabacterium sp.]